VITVYWRAVVNTAMNASVQQEVKNIFNSWIAIGPYFYVSFSGIWKDLGEA
jgi:hypothetical protein